MQKSRRLVIGTVALVASAVTVLTIGIAHASAPSAPFTALTIDGAGDNPVLGAGHSVSATGSAVTLTSHPGGGALISTSGYSVDLVPKVGGSLAVSTSAVPTTTTADVADAGLVVTVGGIVCATGSGTATIHELSPSSGDITTLAVSFSTTCGSSSDKISGEIRYNSSVDYIAATQDKASLSFGQADTGYATATQVVTFTSVGTLPIHFNTPTFGGANPESFRVVANTCSNASVSSSCTITVAAVAAITGVLNATVSLQDNSTAGSRTVGLSATGIVGALGTYHSLSPFRVLDTRYGTGAAKAVVGAGGVIHLTVAGLGGVPASGAMAVVLNVTVTSPTGNSFLTVYPEGVTRPTASNLNFTPGQTLANSVTVKVGTGGKVDIYNSTGTVQIIADINGYFVGSDAVSSGGQYFPVKPMRLLDTRRDGGTMAYLQIDTVTMSVQDPNADTHVTALAVNITAVQPKAGGWFTAWNFDGNATAPNTSTVNFAAGKNTPNMAIVPTVQCHTVFTAAQCGAAYINAPTIGIKNFAKGSVDLIVDVMGYFDDGQLSANMGARFHPITPTRIADSRYHIGVTGPLTQNQTVTIPVPAAEADQGTWALATNVTAVAPTASTFLTFWSKGVAPTLSTLNPAIHQTVANSAIITLSSDANQFNAFNNVGTTGLIVDVDGYYEFDPNTVSSPAISSQLAAPQHAASAGTPRVALTH